MTKYLCLIAMIFSSFSYAIDVTFLNPATPTHVFWKRVSKITQFAADDLDIKLTIEYGNDNRVDSLSKLIEISQRKKKPDFVIFMPYTGNSFQSFQILEEAKINFLTLERSIPQTERERLDSPGSLFKYWRGEIYHDNVEAGAELAKVLIQRGQQGSIEKQLKLFGITGDYSGESYDRSKGLVNATANKKTVKLHQIIHANWNAEQAVEKYDLLIKRYGNAQIVWCASDTMALAITDHHARANPSSKPIIVGGFDWLPEAIIAIEKDQLAASIGGHVFMGAWSLIKIHNEQTTDAASKVKNDLPYKMSVIHKHNVNFYKPLFNDSLIQKFDFRLLSDQFAQQKAKQNFNAEAIIENMSSSMKLK